MLSQTLNLLTLASLTLAQTHIPLSKQLQSILHSAQKDPLYRYPNDITQGIIPKPIHSHNDYWRPVPFYSGLSIGAISFEADVWLQNSTLYIGHDESALTPERTFTNLYLDPILSVLRQRNPDSDFVAPEDQPTKLGVYDASAGQTIYVFVDIKTDGAETWPLVVEALQPLRDAGYLTTFNGTHVEQGPVTIVGTGSTPLNQVQGVAPRDYFFDASLNELNGAQNNVTSDVAPIASTAFPRSFGSVRGVGEDALNATQLETLREQVEVAHAKGMMVRYWAQPGFPIGTRNSVWQTLWEEGVDLLNVDDLEGAARYWEGTA